MFQFLWQVKHSTNVCRVLVSRLYDRHVQLPEMEEEWEKEIRGFIENYDVYWSVGWVSCLREYQDEKLLQL